MGKKFVTWVKNRRVVNILLEVGNRWKENMLLGYETVGWKIGKYVTGVRNRWVENILLEVRNRWVENMLLDVRNRWVEKMLLGYETVG